MLVNQARPQQRVRDRHDRLLIGAGSSTTSTTLRMLGSAQVEHDQVKPSRLGGSGTRYCPVTQKTVGPELVGGPVVFTDYVTVTTNQRRQG